MEVRIDKNFHKGPPDNFGSHCKKKYGSVNAKLILRRLEQARASENYQVLKLTPGRWHWLRGERRYEISADLVHPHRLIFIPLEDIKELLDSTGNVNEKIVLGIILMEVADTHDE